MNAPNGTESQAFVSVCLLAYNHAKTLGAALESVLAQEHRNFELIVSDDCSTDDSWELIQQFARKDERIRPIRTPRNLGMPGNANFAVAHARAPCVALLHHDDVCAPNLLTRWLYVAQKHPSVAFVSNAYGYEDAPADHHPFAECTNGRHLLETGIFPTWGCPIRGTAFIRKSCWDAVGGIREQFGLIADVDLWMRLAARWDVGYVAEPLIVVRHQPPADYPKAYHYWAWSRRRLLYEIHGVNRSDLYQNDLPRLRAEMLKFRVHVSVDELFWLSYAIVKRRWDMLATSEEVANRYELSVVRLARKLLASATKNHVQLQDAG